MFLSLLLIAMITAGGFGLTYVAENKAAFMWRVASGYIIGSAFFGVTCFLLSLLIGFGYVSIILPALLIFLPILRLRLKEDKKLFRHDWDKAKGRIERFTLKRIKTLSFYIFFLVLFIAFFDRAMVVLDAGIFTGASNNLGDLPFHLGAILGFTDGNNFPPQNPSFADTKFTYPFLADFLTAVMVKLGAGVKDAMLFQNVTWAFSLLVILERFAATITKNRLAGKIAPFLLFFSGGLGFVWFFRDYWQGALGFWEFIWNLPKDYTIGQQFRWGNSLVVLFITQRSLLFGMPLALIVLTFLWKLFAGEFETQDKAGHADKRMISSCVFVGVITGMLPLIHAHSLFVLFVISAFLFLFSLSLWKYWISFAFGSSALGLLLLFWMLLGSSQGTGDFIGWHYGFDARGENLFWFWLKNTGLFIPAALAGIAAISLVKGDAKREKGSEEVTISPAYIYFAVPFVLLFVVSNLVKFAPWEWDNIKVLIYCFLGLTPFAAFGIAWLWEKGSWFRYAAAAGLAVLIFAGAIDVWRTASAQVEFEVFGPGAVSIAKAIRERTKPDALFLNAPTYNTAVVLSGRRSFMRYVGHLSSHGIDYKQREDDLKKIYAGEATADILIKKYGIEFVLVSPLERTDLDVNDEFFAKFELFAEDGDFKIYKTNL